jgi:NAD(P)-dependent dehydrogenase (short-subunit alcohol dehydrogenase family)
MKRKVILVTGANRGIGFEIVRQLASLGHEVILSSRNQEQGKLALDKILAEGLKAHFIALDVNAKQQIIEACEFVKEQFGHLDVLINNAGIMRKEDQSILLTIDESVDAIIRTNALAPLNISQVFAKIIPDGGRIIMMSSGGGSMTDPVGGWSPVYCVSKSMLNSITRHLSFALEGNGVSVNAMCPGWVRTDMGGSDAPLSVHQGADTAVWLATAENIPTGKIWRNRKEIQW